MTTFSERLLSGVQTDHQYADGVENLTYYIASSGITISNVKAVGYDTDQNEIAGPLYIKKTVRVWHVFASSLSVEPTPGDYVTDADGYSWTVKKWKTNKIARKIVSYALVCTRRL